MRIEQYLIAALLAGLCIFIGLSSWIAHVSAYDLTDANSALFNETYIQLQGGRNTQKDSLEPNLIGQDVQDSGAEDFAIAGGYRAIQSAYSSTKLVGNVSDQIILQAGLSDNYNSSLWPTIKSTFMVIIGILFLASILYMIFKFQPR